MNCLHAFSRCLLFFFNVIFLICGCAMLGGALWVYFGADAAAYRPIMEYEETSLQVQIIIFGAMGIGAFTILVSVFGCLGACLQNKCMLGFYIFLIVIVMIIQLGGAVVGGIFYNKIKTSLTKDYKNIITKDYGMDKEGDGPLTKSVDEIQQSLKCCGSFGPEDFKSSAYTNSTGQVVPESCCILTGDDTKRGQDYKTCQNEIDLLEGAKTVLYADGCVDALATLMKKYSLIFIGVCGGIAFIQIIGIIAAFCLCRRVKDFDDY